MKVRKAVIPAAGLGTRFLPATKAQPKEMLPLVDTPVIQYVVEEAVAAGIEDILIVTGQGKRAIEEHFDRHLHLEHLLAAGHKETLLRQVLALSELADIHFVPQKVPLGLGHAILQARRHVGNEPFAVLLGDEVFRGEVPCLRELLDQHEVLGGTVVAVNQVPCSEISRYGCVDPVPVSDRLYQVAGLVEKPAPPEAPSDLAIVGRYVIDPAIFDILPNLPPGRNGEIQLTDGLQGLLGCSPMHAWQIRSERFDVGEKLGYLQTTVMLALERPDLGPAFRRFLAEVVGESAIARVGDD